MEQPKFLVGNEKKFFDFISNLNEKDKIAIISHYADLDGIASAKITSTALGADIIKLLNYHELDHSLVEELRNLRINKVVISDMNFKQKEVLLELEKFATVLIIDHHIFKEDYNSNKTIFLNAHGFCAAYICYYLFSKAQSLEKFDWLVACASLSDWAFMKNSEWMNKVYAKYGEVFLNNQEKIMSGKFWDFQYRLTLAITYYKTNVMQFYSLLPEKLGELGELKSCADKVQNDATRAMDSFKKEKIAIKDIYFWEINSNFKVREIVINTLCKQEPNKTFIIGEHSGDVYTLSARRHDGKVNLPELLQKLIKGLDDADAGGHFAAAGGHFQLKNKDEFLRRLKNI